MAALANLVRVRTSTTGTGTLTLGTAVTGFITPSLAGMVNGLTYSYAIEADYILVGDDMVPTSREASRGVYTSAGNTLSRATVLESTNGGSALNLAGDGQVLITGLAEDFPNQTLVTVQKFTSGSGTYTTPASVKWIRVRMCGGGAGGVGSGTAAGSVPTAGGNTTFGSSLLTANGGAIGTWSGGIGGLGGTASLGSGPVGLAIAGGDGGAGGANSSSASAFCLGGSGGSNPFGGSGTGGLGSATPAAGSANSGAGGGGGGSTNATSQIGGGGGGSGGFVNAIITSPLATYSYAVGATGNGGGAGTGGQAGAAGSAGIIIVEEHYNY